MAAELQLQWTQKLKTSSQNGQTTEELVKSLLQDMQTASQQQEQAPFHYPFFFLQAWRLLWAEQPAEDRATPLRTFWQKHQNLLPILAAYTHLAPYLLVEVWSWSGEPSYPTNTLSLPYWCQPCAVDPTLQPWAQQGQQTLQTMAKNYLATQELNVTQLWHPSNLPCLL